MPNEKITTESIGIIAGEGSLPEAIYCNAIKQNKNIKIAALKGFANKNLAIATNPHDCKFFRIGQIGKILRYFNSHNITHICLIGKVSRPNLLTVIPDYQGLRLIIRMWSNYRKGDNKLFSSITNFISEHNLELLGAHELFPELLAPKGEISNNKPSKEQQESINHGFKIAKEIGKEDTGQAIIIKDMKVLAREDVNGTNHMIRNFKDSENFSKSAILIKIKKPNQNEKIDLPTIGQETVELCYKSGISGIVIEAGASLIAEKENTISTANKLGIFIYGK